MSTTTTWTQESITTLEAAIAQGTLRVQYADKLIEYRSLDDMLRTLDLIKKKLGLATKTGGRRFADYSKGLL